MQLLSFSVTFTTHKHVPGSHAAPGSHAHGSYMHVLHACASHAFVVHAAVCALPIRTHRTSARDAFLSAYPYARGHSALAQI
eukprot:6200422-Pleurochrysis_carterae.AAC.2